MGYLRCFLFFLKNSGGIACSWSEEGFELLGLGEWNEGVIGRYDFGRYHDMIERLKTNGSRQAARFYRILGVYSSVPTWARRVRLQHPPFHSRWIDHFSLYGLWLYLATVYVPWKFQCPDGTRCLSPLRSNLTPYDSNLTFPGTQKRTITQDRT